MWAHGCAHVNHSCNNQFSKGRIWFTRGVATCPLRPMVENPMFSGLQAHQARQEAHDALARKAYESLREEFVTALFADPQTTIRTPAYVPASMRAIDAVADWLSNEAGGPLAQLLALLTTCAEHDAPELRIPAQALVMDMARAHATYHAQDLADELEGDA
jgi:hypothetical protein